MRIVATPRGHAAPSSARAAPRAGRRATTLRRAVAPRCATPRGNQPPAGDRGRLAGCRAWSRCPRSQSGGDFGGAGSPRQSGVELRPVGRRVATADADEAAAAAAGARGRRRSSTGRPCTPLTACPRGSCCGDDGERRVLSAIVGRTCPSCRTVSAAPRRGRARLAPERRSPGAIVAHARAHAPAADERAPASRSSRRRPELSPRHRGRCGPEMPCSRSARAGRLRGPRARPTRWCSTARHGSTSLPGGRRGSRYATPRGHTRQGRSDGGPELATFTFDGYASVSFPYPAAASIHSNYSHGARQPAGRARQRHGRDQGGLRGNDRPRIVFNSAVGRPKHVRVMQFRGSRAPTSSSAPRSRSTAARSRSRTRWSTAS